MSTLVFVSGAHAADLGVGVTGSVKTDIRVPAGVRADTDVDTDVEVRSNMRSTTTNGYERSIEARAGVTGNATSAMARERNEERADVREDARLEVASSSDDQVEVSYKLPAKFLGLFSTNLRTTAHVELNQTGKAVGQGQVTVKFPWYRFLFSLDDSAQADVLQNAIKANVEADATAGISTKEGKERTINIVGSLLKSIRASIDASAEVK